MHIPLPPAVDGSFALSVLADPGHHGGSAHDPPQIHQWSSLIGIITAIIGNILISFALNTQRYAHIQIEHEYHQLRTLHQNGHVRPINPAGYGSVQQNDLAEERTRTHLEATDGKGDQNRNGVAANPRDGSPAPSLDPPFEPQVSSHEKNLDDQGRESYLKSTWWWLGLVLMIVGEAGNFLAYGFAPASIVSPLGVVALISNCLIAPLMLKERFRKRDLYGVMVAIGGAVTVVMSANTSEEKFGPGELLETIERWEFLLYVVITCTFILGLMYASPRYGKRTLLVDLGLVGLFGGYTVLSTKGIASLLSASLYKAFAYPITYFLVVVLVLSALMQIRYLNKALQIYDSTQVIPTQFVLFTLSVIIGSAVLYRDFESTTSEQASKFVCGCLLTFFGVYLITSGRQDEDGGSEDQVGDEDEETRLINQESDEIDERTPLKQKAAPIDQNQPPTARAEEPSVPMTPRRLSAASSIIPSIAVTPASSGAATPIFSSADHVDNLSKPTVPGPKTPRIQQVQTEGPTPFFTPPTTYKAVSRSNSSPADPDTPSKTSPRHPSPPRALDADSTPPSFLARSTRGSISRLMPGPLLPPLSSSLSVLVADSLLRGEGSPRSVRAALRRSRSRRHGEYRAVADEENPLHENEDSYTRSHEELSRSHTHETPPTAAADEDQPSTTKTRLRAFSETFSNMVGRSSKGKRREEAQDPSRRSSTASRRQ